MPTQKLEQAAAGLTIGGSFVAWVLTALDWMSRNLSMLSAITLLGGFALQCWSSRRNRARIDADERRAEADERRAEAEEQRRSDEHELKMKILRGELPDRRQALVESE